MTSFTTWHRYEELLKISAFYVVRRKGIDNTDFDQSVEMLKSKGGNIKVLELDFPEVSSTEIRNAFTNNQSVENLIPENIARFISQNGLYRKA